MSFRKYESIENAYRGGYIQKSVDADNSLMTCDYVLQEKLHGANISILFRPHMGIKVFSRNNEVCPTDNKFYGLCDVLDGMSEFIENVYRYCNRQQLNIRLYGELFGGNVQKGVDYGPEKRILFFDMMKGTAEDNMEYIPITRMIDFMMQMDQVKDWFVPNVYVTDNLRDALDFDITINTLCGPMCGPKENVMEGVVIKPYFEVKTDAYGRPFYIKNKNEAFLEKSKAKKPVGIKDIDPIVQELQEEFKSYLTENRLDNIFSKVGPIEDMKDIGKYITEMHRDALEEFLKDFGVKMDALAKSDQKFVTKVTGTVVVPMLKGRMNVRI